MGTAVGLCAALLHYSYWAIAIGQVGTTLTALILSWCFARWFPRRYSRVASARELLGFGGNVTVFNTLNYFARNLDNILIGKVSGERALGFYDRAYKLLLFPLSQITTPVGKVATPLLARTISDERRYEKAYFRLLELIVILTYPGVIAVGINSREFVTHILGIQWADAAPIFAVLAVGAVFAPISSSTSWLMTTQGRTKEMRNYGAISSIAFVASFALGLRWGPLGVARCYIAVGAIQGPILWWAVMRRGPVKFITLLRTLLPYIVASVLVILVEVFLRYLPWDTVGFLVFSLVVAYSVFLVGMSITVAGRGALLEVTTQLRSVLKFRAASE
jgi:PST family polysaccharide transporter